MHLTVSDRKNAHSVRYDREDDDNGGEDDVDDEDKLMMVMVDAQE